MSFFHVFSKKKKKNQPKVLRDNIDMDMAIITPKILFIVLNLKNTVFPISSLNCHSEPHAAQSKRFFHGGLSSTSSSIAVHSQGGGQSRYDL